LCLNAAAAAVGIAKPSSGTAPMPGLKLIGDISCFPTGEGWLYLATALSLCSKELRVAAWARGNVRQASSRCAGGGMRCAQELSDGGGGDAVPEPA
jgi:hypothetical protein